MRLYKINCANPSSYPVDDPKLSHFYTPKKALGKSDNLGIFTQNVLFLEYNKTKKSVTI